MFIKLKNLVPSLESAGTEMYTLDFVCKLIHQTNDTYRAMIGEQPKGEWDQLDEEVKNSTRKGVMFVLKNPEATPEAVHAEWVANRECEGWSHGEVMDEEAKTHPCLTAYDQLPLEHRLKDHLYLNIVKSFVAALKEEFTPSISTECDCSYSPDMWN